MGFSLEPATLIPRSNNACRAELARDKIPALSFGAMTMTAPNHSIRLLLADDHQITLVGMTTVFVPQDLAYMDTTVAQLGALNPRLISLIAHDRAGFGSAVFNVGLVILGCAAYSPPARHLWQALAIAGGVGFATAIGVHPLVGYNNPVHLAPACLGALAYATALAMTRPRNRITSRAAP